MLRTLTFTLLAMATSWASPRALAASAAQAQCAIAPLQRHVEAMSHWNQTVSELIAAQRPELRAVAEHTTQRQSLELKLGLMRFRWLARISPDRLRIGSAPSTALQFEWGNEDESKMSAGEPDYRHLSQQWRRVRQAEPDSRRVDALQRFLKNDFLNSQDYAQSFAPLAEMTADIHHQLRACASKKNRPKRSLTE